MEYQIPLEFALRLEKLSKEYKRPARELMDDFLSHRFTNGNIEHFTAMCTQLRESGEWPEYTKPTTVKEDL